MCNNKITSNKIAKNNELFKLFSLPQIRYLYNIVPEIVNPPMNALFYGEVTNLKSKACFQITQDSMLGMTYGCFQHKIIPSNNFALTKQGFSLLSLSILDNSNI